VFAEFVYITTNWMSYSPPFAAIKFTFSGAWLSEQFNIRHAGLALDQPTVGKSFLATSIMSCLACTLVMLLHAAVDIGHRTMRRWVNTGAILLFALVLIELLVPTFLLVQYVLSMGMTNRRFLGLALCCGLWVLLPSVVIWMWKANPMETKWMRSPLNWAFVVSLVVPAYYSRFILFQPYLWRYWHTMNTVLLLTFGILVVPGLYGFWLTHAQSTSHRPPRDSTTPDSQGSTE
jgi:hypothetical protein